MTQTIVGTRGDDEIAQEIVDFTEIRAGGGDDVVTMLQESSSTIDLGGGDDLYVNLKAGELGDGDVVAGGNGDDRFKVGTLGSSFDGGTGDDLFEFVGDEAGGNIYSGGDGSDTLSYRLYTGGTVADIQGYEVNLSTGIVIPALSGQERIDGIENVIGSALDDILIGDARANRLEGGDGLDTLNGGGGRDTLVAGGLAGDFLIGGSGGDIFVFKNSDIGDLATEILDFDSGAEDRIDLRAIDANDKASGNQAFRFIGEVEFSGRRGELRIDGNLVEADVNGDGLIDFRLVVAAEDGALTRGDFIL